MKRFTETQKWQDVWFMNLPAKYKLAWLWLLDNCDHAGIAEINPRLMEFMIGEPIDADEFLRVMQGRVTKPKPGKWFVRKFIEFQYGDTLSAANSAHRGVIKKLAEAGVECPVRTEEAPAKGLPRTCQGPQDKDKDKDKEQDKDTDLLGSSADSSATRSAGKLAETDEQWLARLKADPAYAGIDIDREFARMKSWCDTNRKQPSRRRFVNWLLRCERPMNGPKSQTKFYGDKL